MTTLTITVNGSKSGEVIFFILKIARENFIRVVDMTWENTEDVLQGEREGHYTISKH